MKASVIVAVLGLFIPPPQTPGLDAEGFIRSWVVLAPVPIAGDSGAIAIDQDFLNGEGRVTPKAGEGVRVGAGEMTWRAHQTSDYFVDFLQSFGKAQGEYVAGYAVTYILAEEAMPVTLALSTNDQGKAWLNGKEIFKFTETRVLEKDTDRVEVTLAKGQNVLVLKVVNEVNNWQGCARFLRNGAPVTNIRIAQAPEK